MNGVKYYITEGLLFISSNIETSDGHDVTFVFDGDQFQSEDVEALSDSNEYFHFKPDSPFEGAQFKSEYQGKLPLEFFIALANKGKNNSIYDSRTWKLLAPKGVGKDNTDGNLEYWGIQVADEFLVNEFTSVNGF